MPDETGEVPGVVRDRHLRPEFTGDVGDVSIIDAAPPATLSAPASRSNPGRRSLLN
jgi:hypothetical protein